MSSLNQLQTRTLAFLGAAIREGQLAFGVEKGPMHLRNAGLFTYLNKKHNVQTVDYGDISILEEEKTMYPHVPFAVRNLNVLGPLLGRLHARVAEIAAKKSQSVLVTVGGDHSIGAATISGMRKVYQNLRVVWVDAHTDCKDSQIRKPNVFNSDNYYGMPLSHISGMTTIPKLPYWSWLQDYPLLNPKHMVLIGIRDMYPDQYINLKKFGVKCYTTDHIDKYGIGEVMTQTLNYLDPNNQHPFHISFDMDAVDPMFINQTGVLCRYGLSDRESVHIVRRVAQQRKLVGLDVAEIDCEIGDSIRPHYRGQKGLNQVTRTVGLGVDLISSVFQRYLQL